MNTRHPPHAAASSPLRRHPTSALVVMNGLTFGHVRTPLQLLLPVAPPETVEALLVFVLPLHLAVIEVTDQLSWAMAKERCFWH